MSVEKQVAIIYLGTKGMLNSVPVEKIKAFEVAFLSVMESKHADTLEALRKGAWGDQEIATIEAVAKDVLPGYTA
jgi:F-type H+-transporting ATPase subunit alpha